MKTFNMIIIDGKKWFQKSYGNTYHSVTVTVDGASIGNSGKHYGYGDQYIQTAFEMLQNNGYFEGMTYNDFFSFKVNNGKMFYVTVSNVNRERDL